MVLCGDFDLIGQKILHRVIAAVVAEFQFEGFASECESAKLVAKTNPENRDAAEEFAYIFNGVGDRLGIAGPVRKKDAIRAQRKDVFGGSCSRNDGNIAMVIDKQAKNVLLDAVIVSDDLELMGIRACAGLAHFLVPRRSGQFDGAFLPIVGLTATYTSGELLAGHQRELFRFKEQLVNGRAIGRNHSAQCTHFTDV